MKTILGIIIILASYRPVPAQTSVLADNADDGCKIKFEKIKSKIDARRKKYEFNVQEYKDGLFCSECGRTKSEIEERAHLSFSQHIRDGATHNRRALIATHELYHDLYIEYIIDFNDLKKEYDDKYNDCGGDNSSLALQTIPDQQFQLYTLELSGDIIRHDQLELTWTDYNFYYAWVMQISIMRWETVTIKTTSFAGSNYKVKYNNGGNAISQAGNILNNYMQTLADKQRAIFLGPGAGFSLTPDNVFAIKHDK
ncbi:hypothetical protein PQ469_04560 [Mucilaginibacter sp. KACC 22773]|uniref:hypothetical protein n=1 Tax=Mucilaginibacter sp. KACC 22773 TaxID=3025671 RepID=UPI0023664458|nr:hypothetical protein [Mucilaginibacter sp. KACC 22773]WDF79272.1 hypothetical protein PQ469_04560 [Mucilaginibacter sp. KACC 22773]